MYLENTNSFNEPRSKLKYSQIDFLTFQLNSVEDTAFKICNISSFCCGKVVGRMYHNFHPSYDRSGNCGTEMATLVLDHTFLSKPFRFGLPAAAEIW